MLSGVCHGACKPTCITPPALKNGLDWLLLRRIIQLNHSAILDISRSWQVCCWQVSEALEACLQAVCTTAELSDGLQGTCLREPRPAKDAKAEAAAHNLPGAPSLSNVCAGGQDWVHHHCSDGGRSNSTLDVAGLEGPAGQRRGREPGGSGGFPAALPAVLHQECQPGNRQLQPSRVSHPAQGRLGWWRPRHP